VDPTGKYNISVLDHFYGEVEALSILEGQGVIDPNYFGDNMVGKVVSMIRDYETNELHAIVSPDRAGLFKDGKMREYVLEGNQSLPIATTMDATGLNNLSYGQIGYNENGKVELLNIHKDDHEYKYRNILKRKDRPKRLAIPSKLRFVNNKPFISSKGRQLSAVNFIEGSFGG